MSVVPNQDTPPATKRITTKTRTTMATKPNIIILRTDEIGSTYPYANGLSFIYLPARRFNSRINVHGPKLLRKEGHRIGHCEGVARGVNVT